MDRKFYLIALSITILLLSLNLASASLGCFKQDSNVTIRVLANCSGVNLTEVTNGANVFILNEPMEELGGQTFSYNFSNTNGLGIYTYSWNNPCIDCSQGDCGNDFIITGNGRCEPEGVVIVLFALAFIIIMFFLVWELIMSMGHFMNLDFDIKDLSKAWGTYFALFALYELEIFYMGSVDLGNWLLLFIKIGAITHLLVPIIAFVISLTVGGLKKQKFDAGTKYFKRTKLDSVGSFS